MEKFDANKYASWMDEVIIEATGNKNINFLYNLWDEVILNTPVRTGFTRYSWRMTPGQPSPYKPDLSKFGVVGLGSIPKPKRPNLEKYRRNYKNFFLVNNQEYVQSLNENEEKYYYMFIENSISRAIAKTKNQEDA